MTNLLGHKFRMEPNQEVIHGRFSENTKFETLANMGSLHFMQNGQEHYIQHTLGMSILDGWTVTDKEGKEVKLIDAYEKETTIDQDGKERETGHLIVKKGLEDVITEELEFKVSRIIREVSTRLYGNYSDQNRAMFQRYVLGKHGIMLRKWIIPGVQKRFKGISNATTRLDDDDAYDSMHYSYILEEFQEGIYVTTARYLYGVYKDIRASRLNALTAQWPLLTDREKANIKRTAIETAAAMLAMTGGIILSSLAKGADDDDKRAALFYSALIFERLESELEFYRSISQSFLILRSPSATVSMLQTIGELFTQVVYNPTERYKTGNKELKIARKAKRAFPVTKQFDRSAEKAYNLMYGSNKWWFEDRE